MNYLSVCSGIEAATVAWHHMGWKPVGFSEIEKFPSQVLAHHYPQVTNYGDITKYKEWNINEPVGLLVGGTPCQSFSVAGLRKGLEDPRGNLALTYVGILDKFRPKWCVWENVPGVLSSNGGRDFGSFLGALVELGYGFSYRVLDSQYFGVAQRRRRVFVVGHLGDWRPTAKVLFESDCLRRNIAKGRKTRQEITRNVAQCFAGNQPTKIAATLQTTCNDYSKADGFNVVAYAADKCPTITASGSGYSRPGNAVTEHETYVAFAMQGNLIGRDKCGPNGVGVSDSNTMYTLTKTDVHAIATSFNVNARPDEMKFLTEQSNTLTASQRSGIGCIGGQHPNAAIGEEISPTLTNAMGAGGGHVPIIGNMAVRRLTEIECERLQGFPDNYTNIKENCPSGSRYKALGNSMAVPVMRWIGERINEYEQRGMA